MMDVSDIMDYLWDLGGVTRLLAFLDGGIWMRALSCGYSSNLHSQPVPQKHTQTYHPFSSAFHKGVAAGYGSLPLSNRTWWELRLAALMTMGQKGRHQ